RADAVTLDPVAARRGARDIDASLGVPGDEVAGAGRGAPDGVARGVLDGDAIGTVAEGLRSADVGADEVALDEVGLGVDAANEDPRAAVGGDDVSRGDRTADHGSSDGVVRRVVDDHTAA